MAGNVVLQLSDSLFLPLNVMDYNETLHSFLQAAQEDLGLVAALEREGISLGTEPAGLGRLGPLGCR